MAKRENEALSLKEILPQMLQENKLDKGIEKLSVKETWEEVMGAGIMSYTEQIDLKNGNLRVKLSSSALREELSYGKEKIVQMMNEALKKVIVKEVKLF